MVHDGMEKDTHGTVRMVRRNVEIVGKDELWYGQFVRHSWFSRNSIPDFHVLIHVLRRIRTLVPDQTSIPDRTEARVWNISGERQLADDLTRTQSTRPISPTPLAQIREEVIELRGMVSTSIDKSRNKETAYRTIANRRDQAERELTEHRASAQERNQPPTGPSGVTPNPLNLGAFSTPEFLSARSRRYMGENSQRTPQQGMAYRSLSYSGLDEIPGYKAHEVRRSNHKMGTQKDLASQERELHHWAIKPLRIEPDMLRELSSNWIR
ncbi:hypothetical protein F2Q68_00010361 [Brassica cretica]|uniref:Uncharacterized protein n=1 Tax=Brassica cretica TaxID=69181 RepID=A0A8S9L0R4_BRACR|nr:hypothetical protein F2Q68_00010361 [Brassica cretica]